MFDPSAIPTRREGEEQGSSTPPPLPNLTEEDQGGDEVLGCALMPLKRLEGNKVIKHSQRGFAKKRSHQTSLISLSEEETGRADEEEATSRTSRHRRPPPAEPGLLGSWFTAPKPGPPPVASTA